MKRLSRLISENNIFKETFLRHILFVSIGLAIILPLYSVLFIHPSFNNLITADKKEEAIGIANHLSSFIPVNAMEIEKKDVNDHVRDEILEHINHFSLVKLKVFSREGEVIYSTDQGDVGKINDKRYFLETVAKGKSFASIVDKDRPSLEGQTIGAEVVETYVPVMKGNKFFGALEIYYDITDRKEQLNKFLSRSTVMLFALAGGFLSIIFIVLVRANLTIAERRRIEEERANSLSLLQATLESTADGILVVDNEGNMVSFNQKFVDMWSIPESILVSLDDDKALEFAVDRLKYPDVFLTKVRELYSQPEAESFDILELKDGRIFERYSQPQRSGGKIVGRVWSFRDVTERNQAEQALQQANDQLELRVEKRTEELVKANEQLRREIEERRKAEEETRRGKTLLQAVFDGISDPLFMLDKNLCVRMLNKAALNYYQVTALEDITGKPCHEVMKGESSACDVCVLPKSHSDGNTVSFERKGLFDTNRLEQVAIYLTGEVPGGLTGCIIRITDITEQKRLEREMIRTDRLASLGQLSGGIAHEIRNPLSGISLFVDILSDEERFELTDREQEIFKEIKGNIKKIDGIIKRILDFARVSEVESTRLHLNNLIQENLKLWYRKMRNADIRLQLSLDKDLPPLWGDAIGIQQVLNNLVQNAVEAMPHGGLLHIATQNGVSSFYEGRPVVVIRVKDTGPGIAPELQEKVFNPFFTTKSTGTGLGLSISHQIVERHGGTLVLDCKQGQETTFSIELPVTPGE